MRVRSRAARACKLPAAGLQFAAVDVRARVRACRMRSSASISAAPSIASSSSCRRQQHGSASRYMCVCLALDLSKPAAEPRARLAGLSKHNSLLTVGTTITVGGYAYKHCAPVPLELAMGHGTGSLKEGGEGWTRAVAAARRSTYAITKLKTRARAAIIAQADTTARA